jgi:uncharacterized coiled-coil protein SlyX
MSEFKCIKCNKNFKLKHHLQRHLKDVECSSDVSDVSDITNQLSTINSIIRTHAELITALQATVEKQQKIIDDQQKQIELLKAQPKEVNTINCPNNQGVAANKIVVNNISSSNTNYVLQLLPKFFNMIYDGKSSTSVRDELMVCIWNNPEHPENHIFYLPNLKKDTVVIQDGNNLRIASFSEIEPDIGNILNRVKDDFHEKKPQTITKWKNQFPVAYKKFVDIFDINSLSRDADTHKHSFNKYHYAKKAFSLLKNT